MDCEVYITACVNIDDRLYIIEKHRDFVLPDDEPVWKRFREWVDAVTKRDSVVRTRSEEKYYEQVRLSRFRVLTLLDLCEISQ